jgi:hypothetical protein
MPSRRTLGLGLPASARGQVARAIPACAVENQLLPRASKELVFLRRWFGDGPSQARSSKELFEPFERGAELMPFSFDVTVELAEEHLVYRAKTVQSCPTPGLSRGREHKAYLETDCNLIYVLRGEIRTIVCIKRSPAERGRPF